MKIFKHKKKTEKSQIPELTEQRQVFTYFISSLFHSWQSVLYGYLMPHDILISV